MQFSKSKLYIQKKNSQNYKNLFESISNDFEIPNDTLYKYALVTDKLKNMN